MQEDSLDSIREEIQSIIISFAAKVDERIQHIESNIESIEKQIATLIIGFGEQAVNMDGLLANLNYASPEAQEAFMKTIAESRKRMLETMKAGANDLLARESQGVASALEDLAEQQLSDDSR